MPDQAGKYDLVFEPSYNLSLVDDSDTDYDVNDHADDDQRPSCSGSMATGTTVPYHMCKNVRNIYAKFIQTKPCS